jgi:hypothetical protein
MMQQSSRQPLRILLQVKCHINAKRKEIGDDPYRDKRNRKPNRRKKNTKYFLLLDPSLAWQLLSKSTSVYLCVVPPLTSY